MSICGCDYCRDAKYVARCDDCGIALDRHGSECGFETGDTFDPGRGRPAGWLNVGTGDFWALDGDL